MRPVMKPSLPPAPNTGQVTVSGDPMPSAPAPPGDRSAATGDASRSLLLAYAAAILVLLVGFAYFLRFALGAMRFPFGMDYTEGEIWRQANAIAAGTMYGDINTYPWIAFEYPPGFYIVANAVAHAVGRSSWRAGPFPPRPR